MLRAGAELPPAKIGPERHRGLVPVVHGGAACGDGAGAGDGGRSRVTGSLCALHVCLCLSAEAIERAAPGLWGCEGGRSGAWATGFRPHLRRLSPRGASCVLCAAAPPPLGLRRAEDYVCGWEGPWGSRPRFCAGSVTRPCVR